MVAEQAGIVHRNQRHHWGGADDEFAKGGEGILGYAFELCVASERRWIGRKTKPGKYEAEFGADKSGYSSTRASGASTDRTLLSNRENWRCSPTGMSAARLAD